MIKFYEIIKRPIITEQSNKVRENNNRYTFEVSKDANKIEIKNAIEHIYNVKVVSVNTVTVLPKRKRVGKYEGLKSGYKKAIVQLVPGAKIPGFEI